MSTNSTPLVTYPPSTYVASSRYIATFWPRFWASLVDLFIVGIAMELIWLVVGSAVDKLGPKGVFLKVVLALPYFAILNSRIGDGQTIGKRWMDIQVVDENGATVSFARSFFRSLVFLVPCYLGLDTPSSAKLNWPMKASVQIFAILAYATLYMVMFNRRNRQGVHDLVARTYVAEHGAEIPPVKSSTWKPHWIIFASLVILDLLLDRLLR
jgi:uncharacterized RDD family membrane protein YckC